MHFQLIRKKTEILGSLYRPILLRIIFNYDFFHVDIFYKTNITDAVKAPTDTSKIPGENINVRVTSIFLVNYLNPMTNCN